MDNKERFEKYCNDLDIVATNVQWKDVYFLADMGEDSVVHFRIKGVKGFLFGIWFNHSEENYDDEYFKKNTDTLFYQEEIYLDKFKPSRSTCYELRIKDEDFYISEMKKVQKELITLKKFKYQRIEGFCPIRSNYWKAKKGVLKSQIEGIKQNLNGDVMVPSKIGNGFYQGAKGKSYFLKCLVLIKKYGYKNIDWEYVFLK